MPAKKPAKKPEEKPEPLRISAVAERAGVSKQTVEYYILLGLLRPVSNPKTRRRVFDEDDVRRIKLIRQLNASGYPLREIREIWLKDESD